MYIGVIGGITGGLQQDLHGIARLGSLPLDFCNACVQPLAPLHRRAHDAACRCGKDVIQLRVALDLLPQLRLAGIGFLDGTERLFGVFFAEFIVILVVVAHDLSPVSP